jgi:hypothetical protein
MTDTNHTNGNGEPSPKEREIAAYLAERSEKLDASVAEVTRLKAVEKGLLVTLEVREAQLTDAQSKVQTAELVRDEAVARRAELEALLKTIQSALRAFHITHEPLLREIPETESPTIGGA